MTALEITQGNKLIAEFMGGQLVPFNSYINMWVWDQCPIEKYREGLDEHSLKFHLSHDWLIPVIEKIEKENYGFKMCRRVVEVYFDDTKEVILKTKEDCRLNSLFKAVVQFIEWYNKNIKNKD